LPYNNRRNSGGVLVFFYLVPLWRRIRHGRMKIRSDSSKGKARSDNGCFNCAIGFVIIYIEEQLGDNLTWELATYTSGRRVERDLFL